MIISLNVDFDPCLCFRLWGYFGSFLVFKDLTFHHHPNRRSVARHPFEIGNSVSILQCLNLPIFRLVFVMLWTNWHWAYLSPDSPVEDKQALHHPYLLAQPSIHLVLINHILLLGHREKVPDISLAKYRSNRTVRCGSGCLIVESIFPLRNTSLPI